MDKKEFALLAAALKTYYPKENLLPNSQAMELWYRQLQDMPYQVAEAALNMWVVINKWPPTIADLREKAVSVVNGPQLLWSDGWGQVMKAIKKYGSYKQTVAMDSFDDITKQCVQRLGYQDLCQSTNIMVDRANFRMIFEQLSGRQQQAAQIPATLSSMIEEIQRKGLVESESKRISGANPED